MQVQARNIVTHLRVLKFAEQLKIKNIFFLSAFVQQTILHGGWYYMLYILIIMAASRFRWLSYIYTDDQL